MLNDRDLDHALAAWARAPASDAQAAARILARVDAMALAAAPPRWRALWAAGGAVAASAVLALVVTARPPAPEPAVVLDPEASFALLYTPLAEEESLL